jgi:hypothetical protein
LAQQALVSQRFHRVLPPAIVGVYKPDPVRQLAWDNRRVMSALCY